MVAITWVQAHWDLISVVLAIVLAAVEVVRATGSLRQGLLSLMLQAEKASGKGELGPVTGPAIMDMVVRLAMERVVPRLPVYVRPFITESMVRKAALWVYAHAKTYLEHGTLIDPAPSNPSAGGDTVPPANQ